MEKFEVQGRIIELKDPSELNFEGPYSVEELEEIYKDCMIRQKKHVAGVPSFMSALRFLKEEYPLPDGEFLSIKDPRKRRELRKQKAKERSEQKERMRNISRNRPDLNKKIEEPISDAKSENNEIIENAYKGIFETQAKEIKELQAQNAQVLSLLEKLVSSDEEK